MDYDSAPRRSFINTYLDSPIIEGSAKEALVALIRCSDEGYKGQTMPDRTARRVLKALGDNSSNLQLYDPHDLPFLLSSLPANGFNTHSVMAHDVALPIFVGVVENLKRKCQMKDSPVTVRGPSSTALRYLNKAQLLVRFVDSLSVSRSQGSHHPVRVDHDDHLIVGNQYYVVWRIRSQEISNVFPFEAILMMKDLLLARANVFDTLRVVYPSDTEMRIAVKDIFKWCERCLEVHGNKGYEILKNLEPIAKAYVITMADDVFHQGSALDRMVNIVKQKEKTHDPSIQNYLVDDLVAILQRCGKVQTVVETFGLQKLTGHPLINPVIGGESAAYEASIPRSTTLLDAKRLRNNWCRMYTEGFVKRTHRWPELEFNDQAKQTRLYQLYSARERNISKRSYCISDWEGVKFLKNSEFEYFTNFLDLMDDKSISFYLSEFRATWRDNVRPRSHKRLLLEMLSRPKVSIRAIIELVEAGDIPEDWLIVSLYPKEREFKLSARMFSMMVFEMRAFFACLEANLADKVFPYLPQQTMTLKKTEIQSLLFKLTKPSSSAGVMRLFIEVDLSRWNLRWRDMPIRMIGEDVNDIFGLKRSYTQIHEFFKRCLILVRVAGYEPDGLDLNPPPTSSLLWYEHEGGFEGIAQKHWTLATYSMIDLGVTEFDFNYQIIGQADNQVILAHVDISEEVDPKDYMKRLSAKVAQSVSDSCARVGQDAKPEECLESTCVVTYSKDFFVSGSEYLMTLKAFSRIFPRGTSEFPTIINCVGAIGSGCVAASEKMKNPIYGYYLMLYHAARYLLSLSSRCSLESLLVTKAYRSSLTKQTVSNLLVLPSSLGGLPLPTCASFLYKGGSDPLSKDLSGVTLLPENQRVFVERCLNKIILLEWTKRDHDAASILMDPYSIPISAVQLAESRVQATSLEHVKTVVQNNGNQDISQIVGVDIAQYEGDLTEVLMKVRPFNPAFLADIMDHSVIGVKRMISRMFTATRTVQSLTQGDETDPGGLILRSSAASFSSICHRISTVTRSRYKITSVFETATVLRSLWTKLPGSPIESVEGITNYVPLDWQFRTQQRKPSSDEIQVIFVGGKNAGVERGPFEPYLGSDTHEKRTKYGYKIVVSSSAEKASAQLYKIMTQPGVSESFENLVASVAETRTGTDLRSLVGMSSRAIGGNIAHRYTSSFDLKTASLVGCSSFAGHIALQSDYSGVLSASLVDYPVMFQESYVLGTGVLNFMYHSGSTHATTLGIVVPDTLVPLPEEDVVSTSEKSLIPPRLVGNDLAYCEDLRLLRQERPHATEMIGLAAGALSIESSVSIARAAAARELRRSSLAESISDTSKGAVRLSIDVLEYRGLGMENVVLGISQAITDHIYHSLFVRPRSVWRWTAMPMMSALGSAFSHSLVRVATHPLFKDDAYVQTVIRPSDMGYSYYKTASRVGRSIARMSHAEYVKIPRPSETAVRILYQDDEESASLEVVITCFRKGLVCGFMSGEITSRQAQDMDKITLLQRMRGLPNTQIRLGAVYSAVLMVIEFCQLRSLTTMGSYFESLAEGKLLKIMDTTLAESLRLRRQYAMNTTASREAEMQTHEQQTAPWSPTFRDVPNSPRHLVFSPPLRHSLEYERFCYRRMSTREFGYDAPAVHSFWPARHALRSRCLVIIGSGNGGCAAVASMIGVERVVLHDLQKDVRPEAWQSPSVNIPILNSIPSKSYIERSTAGFGDVGGDVTSSRTWEDLKSLVPIEATVVYDLPIGSPDSLVWLVGMMVLHFPQCPLITRWILSVESMTRVLENVYSSFSHVEVYPIFWSSGHCEVVMRFSIRWGQSLRPSTLRLENTLTSEDTSDPEGVQVFGGGRTVNWITEFGDLDVEIEDEEMLLTRRRESLLEEASRKTIHGFSYSEWTRVLWFKFAQRVKNLRGLEREVLMIDTLQGGCPSVTLGSQTLFLAQNPAFVDFLRRTLPRCI